MNTQYNVLIDTAGVVLVGTILIAEHRQKRHGDPFNTKLLHSLLLCCTLVFLMDIPGLLLDGRRFPGAGIMLWMVDSAYWGLQIIYCWLWVLFADYWAFGSHERLHARRMLYALPALAELAVLLANPFTGWIFTIDAANIYARGSGYVFNILPYAFYIVTSVGIIIKGYRVSTDPEQKRRKLALAAYMFLPACGVFLDIFLYGISWVWPMEALSILMVYLNVQQQAIAEEQLAAARLEAELTDSRVAVMLSQIQPHFLFNALNTVDALCDVDTRAAQKAIRSFAKYLRGNLDALSRKTPVPFREELSHLRQYLTLEEFRFDNIQVIYDLDEFDFMMPPLSLQPIVENAVKYGVLKRKNGGTITIATRDKKDHIQLTVVDDGVGFDPSKSPADGRSHIGIENVRRHADRGKHSKCRDDCNLSYTKGGRQE